MCRALWSAHRWPILGVAVLSEFSYILVLTAMSTTPVSYVAPAREVSILIGTVSGRGYWPKGTCAHGLRGPALSWLA